jgi:hypothetical protein
VLLLIFVVHVTSHSGRMLLPLFYIIAAAAAAACPIRIEREREKHQQPLQRLLHKKLYHIIWGQFTLLQVCHLLVGAKMFCTDNRDA